MNTQYKIDKTAVATKNRASADTSAEMKNGVAGVWLVLQTVLPNRNGYSNE